MYLDSKILYIYLPVNVSVKSESDFGLFWDPVDEICTVNDTAHALLTSRNPSITFTIVNAAGQDSSHRFSIPLSIISW